jgi:hypothetical protein
MAALAFRFSKPAIPVSANCGHLSALGRASKGPTCAIGGRRGRVA